VPVVDLAISATPLPISFVVDANILVEQIVGLFPTLNPPVTLNAQRSHFVFQSLISGTRTGVVTPTVLHEVIHYAVKSIYKLERVNNRAALRARFGTVPDWNDLYKLDPSILQIFRPSVDRMFQIFAAAGLLIASPHDGVPASSTQRYDEMLANIVCGYGLDSNDAAILLEARSLGITDIVTLDKDLLRAQADFTIYTWL
jgi:predicted nucleic acid-binding protein